MKSFSHTQSSESGPPVVQKFGDLNDTPGLVHWDCYGHRARGR